MDLHTFWEQSLSEHFARILDDVELGLIVDHSGYIYIDGEEGDHGVVRYLHDGNVVAIKTIHGGDCEELDVTEYGKPIIVNALTASFHEALLHIKVLV